MIPIKLRITGFTSYRKPVEIDFSGFELACISGPNGAGKSSLLDAITYALYGEARKKDAAIINTAANKAEVQLDFEYESQTYRVIRSITRANGESVEHAALHNAALAEIEDTFGDVLTTAQITQLALR